VRPTTHKRQIALRDHKNGQPLRYSICITHYNNFATVRKSLESVLCQVKDDYEVVVVDSESNDGSLDVLREYAKTGLIKLIIRKCSRGRGRQIAFENSTGTYVIANVDMDDILFPRLAELLQLYHTKSEGKLLMVTSPDVQGYWGSAPVTIIPRELVIQLGGWRDLMIAEDDLLERMAAEIGRYAWTTFPILQLVEHHKDRRRALAEFRFNYVVYRDYIRAGFRIGVFPRHPLYLVQHPLNYVAYLFARVTTLGKDPYLPPASFSNTDERYFIDYGAQRVYTQESATGLLQERVR
jgi:glycosyltransferase involved in cell wall biosynthesis